jgi:hypothetical protein
MSSPWHLTRVEDDHVSELAGRAQAWLEGGWHARFAKPADPNDTQMAYVRGLVEGRKWLPY